MSIGDVKAEPDDKADITDDDRGFVTHLSEQSVMELIKSKGEVGERNVSIGSITDPGTTSFGNKKVQQLGDEFEVSKAGIGFTCRKGLKPESPNQDSWIVMQVGHFMIYAVFDGHGKHGHHVSNFVKENLPKLILRDGKFKTDQMESMLVDIFKKIQRAVETTDRMGKISAQLSGTTATVAIHNLEKNKLTLAHVADSTCVMGSTEPNGKLKGVPLTRDHKPDLKDEKKRIESSGGVVIFDGYANHRVYAKGKRRPGLNMSRCLGDLLGHSEAGLSCEPEHVEMDLSDNDEVLLLCSDGVWEFISPQEACEIVTSPATASQDPTSIAEVLAKEAWNRWIAEEGGQVVDDITVVLIFLKKARTHVLSTPPKPQA